ncbi:MAG: DUF1254 domain-containing protein [Verrucomicrobiaceae bacterium]
MTADDARQIACDAYVYGYPIVDNYRIWYAQFVDSGSSDFKAPWNSIANVARVFTPEDKAIQTPNSDTPYSFAGLDLRAEPIVLTIPPVDKGRYFSVQLIDAYTHNFDYIGSRTTGNGGGSYLIAAPGWTGKVPAGIDKVFNCETEFCFAFYRTQLMGPADIENVKSVQAGYRVQPLSTFAGQPAPAAAPALSFPKPITVDEQRSSPEFFRLLNFVLGYCPADESETGLRARFATLGIDGSPGFDVAKWPPDVLRAVKDGMADGWQKFATFKAEQIDTLKKTSSDVFGTRAHLNNDYMLRMAGAVLGIYGNSQEEAIYPMYLVDAAGAPLDASKNAYTLNFPAGQLPPVDFFWSITLYALPAGLLHANALNRYLINSPMLPGLVRDADGGLTIHVQTGSPGADRETNWLPAPNGPFYMAMRLYGPQQAAVTGAWKQPPLHAKAL